jgi:glycyl-tRNA synthetase
MQNFQSFTLQLIEYWSNLGCLWTQPYDQSMGAGTFHPHTFLKGLGPEPWRSVYVQPCRRPVDGRYGENPYRFQHYYQLQVLLKPAPSDIVDVFLRSLEHVGIKLAENDISLLEDDWKGPTLGAWGLGWEVRANGQEVTQFTYFQQLGGLDLDVISGEITYGLERLYMYRHGLKNALEMPYNDQFTYGDIFKQNEFEFSHFNFKQADTRELFEQFNRCEANVQRLCELNLVLPAYDYVLQASHAFNLLDARGAISVSERQRYIGRVRDCARLCAQVYRTEREKAGFPMMSRLSADPRIPFLKQDGGEAATLQPFNDAETKPGRTRSFVVELGVEEMPPGFQLAAKAQLSEKLEAWKNELRTRFAGQTEFLSALESMRPKLHIAPRRLALTVEGLPEVEPSIRKELWGPVERIAKATDGSLTPAAVGFAKKAGVEPSALTFKTKADGTFLFAEKNEPGRCVPRVLAEAFIGWTQAIEHGLKMKWIMEANAASFVRPVRWICALVDDAVLPVQAFGLTASSLTWGQRVLHSKAFELKHARDYAKALREHGVEPDHDARCAGIVEESRKLAASVGGVPAPGSESLVEKIAGLSESPKLFAGRIDPQYLRLPARLITSVLREHMNYFSVIDPKTGGALPAYIGASGYACTEFARMVEATGHVVTGRLEDGSFYYDGDLKTPLSEFQEKLANQLFNAGMGSLLQKSTRVSKLAGRLAGQWPGTTSSLVSNAEKAGLFCKADLKSGCVQEFPDEMQGVMGGILVRSQKTFGADSEAIAEAIATHYSPAGASDSLPEGELGRIVSLADKLDSLVMLIGHGNDVKGNKDPFGLRRLALGVLRLLGLDGESRTLNVPLTSLIAEARTIAEADGFKLPADTSTKVLDFILGRARAAWRSHFDPGAVEAVLARSSASSLLNARALVAAASKALEKKGQELAPLALALVPYKRCRTLTEPLIKEGKSPSVQPAHLQLPEERALYEALLHAEKQALPLLEAQRFEEYLQVLAELRQPMAAFFDKVLVNAPEEALRLNRLGLLLRIRTLYDQVGDFSQIQVAG